MKFVILAGGGGTRLFPLSRCCYPKQFLKINSDKSLLAQTIERFLPVADPTDILIVTNEDYLFHVKAELKAIHAENAHIILEPVGRNTAPAITLAMTYCKEKLHCGSSEIIFVCPSDHVIKPAASLLKLIKKAEPIAESGKIITFGITPSSPETGYGYIEAGNSVADDFYTVSSFKEKPDMETAEKYLNSGNYYWNSGMFMFSIRTMDEELKTYAPQISEIEGKGLSYMTAHFDKMPDISIDYAVAEKSSKIAVAPLNNIYWNDIGSFDAIYNMLKDKNGDVLKGDIIANNCKGTMIWGDKRLITGIDLKDIMVIDTPDVLLVAKRGESQKVKELVNQMKQQKRPELDENVTMYRPWGSYTVLSEGPGYKVKKICINPGQSLSLQMHYHRSEHWTVISGTGELTLDDKKVIFTENESTYIPIGTKHRLSNPGKLPLVIIEVQNGKYLGEDDIVRFTDIYGRVKKNSAEEKEH